MRKLLLSGASVALLSLGAAALPSFADSPSTVADPIGNPSLVQVADSGTATDAPSDMTDTTDPTKTTDTTGSETTGGSDATGATATDGSTVDPAASGTDVEGATTDQATGESVPETVPEGASTPTEPSDTALDADRSDDAAEEAADAAEEAEEEPAPTGQLAAETVQPPETVAVEDVLDADVIDINGEDVASVYDVLVAPDGRLTHVVVSYGGFLGIGTKEVLVPWESVSYNAAQDTLQIRGNEADLEAAPGFVTQEELQDQQEAERAAEATPSPTGATAPQQAQTPDPE